MCAKIMNEIPKRKYKQRKSKYSNELWDNMPLHKEPKTKRSENEEEIVANYRAMMNKPKRKYKQRKSKYDSELWNSLPLHKPSKRIAGDDKDEANVGKNGEESIPNEKDSDRICLLARDSNIPTNVIGHQHRANNGMLSVVRMSCSNESDDLPDKGQNINPGLMDSQTASNTSTKTNLVANDSTSSDRAEKQFSDVLFVQKVLGFLLNEQDITSKKYMIDMLKKDGTLNSICLKEISKRCGSLKCLKDTNLCNVVKEHVFLMKLYQYLSKCQVSKSHNDSSLQADKNTVLSETYGQFFTSRSSTHHENYENVRPNNQYTIGSGHRTTDNVYQVQTEQHLVENVKDKASYENVGKGGKSENGNVHQVHLQHEEEPFPIITWLDVSLALPTDEVSSPPLPGFVPQLVDNDETFCDNVIRDWDILESMNVDDCNTSEILRLAAAIANPTFK